MYADVSVCLNISRVTQYSEVTKILQYCFKNCAILSVMWLMALQFLFSYWNDARIKQFRRFM